MILKQELENIYEWRNSEYDLDGYYFVSIYNCTQCVIQLSKCEFGDVSDELQAISNYLCTWTEESAKEEDEEVDNEEEKEKERKKTTKKKTQKKTKKKPVQKKRKELGQITRNTRRNKRKRAK